MSKVPCYAVEDPDCLMDTDFAQRFHYGFCQELFYIILFAMFNFHIHVSFSICQTFVLALVVLYIFRYMLLRSFKSHIHVFLSSHQNYVLTLAVLYTLSYMYIHAVDLAVDQLLVFLHVSIRVKFIAYCLLEIIFYISIHLNHAITTSLLNILSIVLFFQYLTSARLLNSLPLFTVCSGVIVIYCCYINRIWLHSTYIFISTFVLLLTLFCLIIING